MPKTNKYSAKVQRKKTTVLWLFRSYYVLSYRSSYTLMYIWCTIGAHLLGTSLSVTHEGCPGQRSALTQSCPVQCLSWLRTVRNSAQLWLSAVLYSVYLGWALSRTEFSFDSVLSYIHTVHCTVFILAGYCPGQRSAVTERCPRHRSAWLSIVPNSAESKHKAKIFANVKSFKKSFVPV